MKKSVATLSPREQAELSAFLSHLRKKNGMPLPNRAELARELMGAGRRWVKPGSDPVGDLARQREIDDELDRVDDGR